MLDLAIPGYGRLRLTDLVCDFNGTLAASGELAPGVRERLPRLAELLRIHIVTGDTFGTARAELAGMPCAIVVLAAEGQAEAKARFARELGTPQVVAIGNGRNDRLLLEAADLAIGVCGHEGIATAALQASDVIVPDAAAALDLLLETNRLVATLRS
jgi:P-type E1-E2 ATPase